MSSNLDEESPYAAYQRSLQRFQAELSIQQRRHRLLGYAKLALGLLLAILIVRFVHELHGAWPLAIVAIALVLLSIVHERVLQQIQRTNVLIDFYQRGVARLEDRWAGTGESGERFLNPAHPYARDLDILGAGSLFELLCTMRT